MTMARVATWSPWHTSRTFRATKSHPRSLLSIPRLRSASSRIRPSIWNRTRSAQMSLGLNGAFWPMILPLFHGSRRVVFPAASMMDSHRVEGHVGCAENRQKTTILSHRLAGETHFPCHMNRIRCANRVRELQLHELHNPLHPKVARPRETACGVDTDQANDLPGQLVCNGTLLEAAG